MFESEPNKWERTEWMAKNMKRADQTYAKPKSIQ